MSEATQPDGGRNALAGFLYQIVGVLGLKANASPYKIHNGEQEIDALVTVATTGRLEHESLCQDAVLSNMGETGEELSLIQFKFSLKDTPRTIPGSELKVIVDKLVQATKEAKSQGKSVTGFYLVTNRTLAPGVEAAKGGRTIEATILANNISANDARASARETLKEKIQKELKILSNIPISSFFDRLKGFATQFGCQDSEVERGIDSLIGGVHKRTVFENREFIKTQDLIKAFTQFPGTRPLTYREQYTGCCANIDSFYNELGLAEKVVRREIFNSLDDEITSNALVVIEGLGGSGKTTALVAWTKTRLKVDETNAVAVIRIFHASHVYRSLVREVICECADIPTNGHLRRSESTSDAIERLLIANPDCFRPVFLLGIDGLDEGTDFLDRKQFIEEILHWFWKEDEQAKRDGRSPKATLVVTCRNARETIDDWLSPVNSGFQSVRRQPRIIRVEDFTLAELLRAANQSLPHLYDLFRQSIEGSGAFAVGGNANSSLGSDSVGMIDQAIPFETLAALQHPAVWRALLELPDDIRQQALTADRTAVRSLAKVFTNWFCIKARLRRFKERTNDDVLKVLIAISSISNGSGFYDYASGWLEPAMNSKIVGPADVSVLYNEAVTAGYIVREANSRWRWRHPMCADYLSTYRNQNIG